MKGAKRVVMERSVVDGLIAYAKSVHPNEGILLLRGKVRKDEIRVTGLIIPPLPVHGEDFSSFNPYMLPFDASILGVAHSHPSGVLMPSTQDLLHYYGRIMVIVAYPYRGEEDIGVFDRDGNPAVFDVD